MSAVEVMRPPASSACPAVRLELPPVTWTGAPWSLRSRCLVVLAIAEAHGGYAIATDASGSPTYRAVIEVSGVRLEVSTPLEAL